MITLANNKLASAQDLIATWNRAYPNSSRADSSNLAQTKTDVDNMTLRDRLWDAFNFAYGQQSREFKEQSNNEISQQGRRDLSRGMQRSSYGAATEANMRNKQLQGLQDIYGQQIAAYEQALLNVEQQEREAEQWQKEFDEQVRQFNILHPQDVGGGEGGSSGGRRGSGKKTTNPDVSAVADALARAEAIAKAQSNVVKPGTPTTTNKDKKSYGGVGTIYSTYK